MVRAHSTTARQMLVRRQQMANMSDRNPMLRRKKANEVANEVELVRPAEGSMSL